MRDPRHITVAAAFLVVIFGVPITQAVVDLVDDMPPQALELFEAAPTEEHLRSFEDALEQNSLFEEKGRELFQLTSYLTVRRLGEKATPGHDGWYFYTPGVRYLAEPYFRSPRSASRNQDDPVAAILDFEAQLEAAGIALLVVPVPGKGSIYPDRLSAEAPPDPAIWANTTRLREELEARGVRTVDLHAALLAARRDRPTDLYMHTDTHWTGAGVRVAAATLAAAIRAGGWAPPPPDEPRFTRTAVQVDRRGDVIEMTKIPERDTLFDGETVEVFQVKRSDDGALYEDADDAPILILGDSFSRVFQTDEPEAAGLIANVAFELQAPIASIVNDGGASTLVRESLARRPELLAGKKLVIWEFVERDIRFGMKGWQKVALEAGEE